MANVLLLRARSLDEPDKYEDSFRGKGYNPISIPVLETVLKDLPNLTNVVEKGPEVGGYAGVIVTSARACEAWKVVVGELVSGGVGVRKEAEWPAVPFYAVGEATGRALSDIGETLGHSPYTPRDIRGRSETGTSEKLAHFILEDLSPATGSRKLLYLTGDKNRDTLPKILRDGGFELQSLQVYETRGSSDFPHDLSEVVGTAPAGKWWIVYFAPSAADFVTPHLKDHFSLPPTDEPRIAAVDAPTRIAAIGPTTSMFLRDELKLAVDAVPAKPNPEALVAAIASADSVGIS